MRSTFLAVCLFTSAVCLGQNSRTPIAPDEALASNRPSSGPTSAGGSEYLIGSDDQLDITVFEIQELAAQPRVSASGTISLNLIGSITAKGLTPHELEDVIEAALRNKKLVNDPQVSVSVREYASQPVSIFGAVRRPGIFQIKGQKTLFSMISQAEGLDQSTVGRTIQVFRAKREGSTEREVITIDIQDFQRGNIALDIPIYANDTINVQTAGSVFVMGEVANPDEFVLRNGVNINVLQAVTKAGGPTRDAKRKASMIIRLHPDGMREEIPVNLDKIQQGKMDIIEMMPNDILVVPSNRVKSAINRGVENSIAVVTGRLIYRF